MADKAMDNSQGLFPVQPQSRSFNAALQQGGEAFQDLLTTGKLGPLFGQATPLLQQFTGKGLNISDETGTATISPQGDFDLAGKYGSFQINPLGRKVGATYINPENKFSIGGSIGMGTKDFYNPTAEINFSLGQGPQPVMTPDQINIEGLPLNPQDIPSMSPARLYEMQQTSRYQQANPTYYRQY
jgi:hypothetical protein